MLSGDGRLTLLKPWRGREIGLLNGDEGVEGADEVFDEMPSSVLHLRITEWRSESGPKAKRIISFSPWSWIKRRPMILEAFSGSKLWILEKTTFVAS